MMERTWIDDEGRLRLEHDENYQLITPPSYDESALIMDSWNIELACKMIALGRNFDVKKSIDYGFTHCPYGTSGRDRANALITVMNRILSLAKAAVAIGKIKDHDTPSNWIAWAKDKGYNTEHLDPLKHIQTVELALSETESESFKESYQEQIEGWQKVAKIWGLTMAEPTSKIGLTSTKSVSERLNKYLSHLEIVGLWIDTEEHRNVMNHYRETIHQAFKGEESVQYDEKLTQAIHDNHELKDRYFKAINQAVTDGDLKAETSISDSGVRNWKIILYSPTMLRTVQGDTGIHEGREVYVQHMINRDDFRAWLKKTHQWPVPDDCSLSQWFDTEPRVEAVEKLGVDSQAKTIVNERDNQLHILIWRVYQFLCSQSGNPTAQKTWSEIQYRYTDHDTDEIIQEVTVNQILWRSVYGNEQKLSRSSFDKTLSNLKKNPPF